MWFVITTFSFSFKYALPPVGRRPRRAQKEGKAPTGTAALFLRAFLARSNFPIVGITFFVVESGIYEENGLSSSLTRF